MNHLFSIIVPTYNRAHLIEETIGTVISQTYQNYEIIVVDNYSVDNTEEVMKKYADNHRIKYIRHDKNYERSKSRNTGLQNATGDYVTFLDSDDFMYPDCLNDANIFAISNPELKFFQNKYEYVNDRRELVYSPKFPSLKNQYKALASGNFIGCIGGFLHKDIYKNMCFNLDPKMIGSEDFEIWFKVLAKYKMGRIEKINSGIREHPQRSVHGDVYNNLEYQKEKLVNKIISEPQLLAVYKNYIGRLKSSYSMMNAVAAAHNKKRSKSFQYLAGALVEDQTIIVTRRFWGVVYNIIKKI